MRESLIQHTVNEPCYFSGYIGLESILDRIVERARVMYAARCMDCPMKSLGICASCTRKPLQFPTLAIIQATTLKELVARLTFYYILSKIRIIISYFLLFKRTRGLRKRSVFWSLDAKSAPCLFQERQIGKRMNGSLWGIGDDIDGRS